MEALYHVSEEAGITRFEPRPSPSALPGIDEPVVFAIREGLLHNYLLPRDCPRVTFYAGPGTCAEDRRLFLCGTSARFVVAIEAGWIERISSTYLYCYDLPAATFEPLDVTAGYYVSRAAVVPSRVVGVEDPLRELVRRDVELRIMPSLWRLRDAVVESSLEFSIIRMRNARARAD